MFSSLTDRQKLGAAVAAFCALLAILVAIMAPRGQSEVYIQLPLAYKLRQQRAINLSPLQMNGSEPLMFSDSADGDPNAQYFLPPRLGDILGSMRHDAVRLELDGLCAMNYNKPVAVCYLPRFGRQRDVVMFNLMMIGFSSASWVGDEYSLLCDRGEVAHGVERFQFVWIEFWDINGERNVLRVDGRIGRVIQHLAWLNKGVSICDGWSLQKQADVIYELATFQMSAQ